ncbi:MAG: hypothetical protein ACR2IK_10470 [Chloroflexota bacterium]
MFAAGLSVAAKAFGNLVHVAHENELFEHFERDRWCQGPQHSRVKSVWDHVGKAVNVTPKRMLQSVLVVALGLHVQSH